MMTRLRLWLDALRTSLWFVPTLIVLGSVVMAYALLAADSALPGQWWQSEPWKDAPWLAQLLDVRLAGATAMLQVIGTSMMTVVGVVFSITMVALTMASGQYTSRVMRNFIRDRANQTVLGTFLGIFVYSMLVLRSLSGTNSSSHAPALSLLMALALAFVGIGVLIFFIHHIALGLQATNVVASIARDALPSIDRHFPSRDEPPEAAQDVDLAQPAQGRWYAVRARRSGYVTGIDLEALVDVATDADGLIRVRRPAGSFAAEGESLAELRAAAEPEDHVLGRIHEAWSFGVQRTLENDPGYGMRQLVDVALKALSPGVNETTTAVMCVNWLGVMLMRMSDRRFPPRLKVRDGHPRVLTGARTFDDYLMAAFNQIRQCATGNVAVLGRQLEVLEALAATPAVNTLRHPLLRQVDAIDAMARDTIPWPADREPLQRRVTALRETLGAAVQASEAERTPPKMTGGDDAG